MCKLLNTVKSHSFLLLVSVLFFFLLLSVTAEGQRYRTWTGEIDNSWNKAGNWNPKKVPDNNTIVYIYNVHTGYPVITEDATVRGVVLSRYYVGADLTVTNGATFTVTQQFQINGNGQLFLDNGTLKYDGDSRMSHVGNMLKITNGGELNISNAWAKFDGTLLVDSGDVNFGNGFQISNGKLFEVNEGNVSVYGQTNIYGTLNGGAGHFTFNGDTSTSGWDQDQVTISNGGRFYMAPASSDNTSPNCSDNSAELSGGTVDFYIPAYVGNNGVFNGGNALVSFYNTVETQSGSVMQVHNGTLSFKGDANVNNGAEIEIVCEGTIEIEGDGTFQQGGSMIVGDGNLIVSGDAVFQNGGTLDADDGTITFEGDVTIANSGGEINAGSSTITFSGGTFDNSGTFEADSSTFVFAGNGSQKITGSNSEIEFYNLVVEEGADVQSSQDVIVSNDMTVEDGAEFDIDDGKTIDVVGELTGDSYIKTNRPYIISITINSVKSITAVFNEELDPSSIVLGSYPWWWPASYTIMDDDGDVIDDSPNNPTLGGANNNEITLTLNFEIERNKKYYLIVNNVKNLKGKRVSWYHTKRFVWSAAEDQWQWIGLVDSVWLKSGNWFSLKLPEEDSRVLVPVTPHEPVISSKNNKINALEIKEGASLTINTSGNLTVEDSIKNEAGNAGLVVVSSAEGTGSLIHNNDGVPASFQRYISGGAEAWQMLSSPVGDQEISGDFTPTGTVNGDKPYGDSTRYDLYAWYEPDTSWVYLLNNDQAPTWSTANDGSNNFVPGRGYLVLYKDSFPTKVFKGTLNNGDVSIQLTDTEDGASEFGFNLIGNPYPSSIDWKSDIGWSRSVLNDSNGGYNIWIWSEENMNYGAYNSNSDSDEGTLGVSRYIAPNQGFFVKAARSGTFSMNNEVRVHEGSSNWIKSASFLEQNNIAIRLKAPEGYGEDEVLIELERDGEETGTYKKFSFISTAPSLYLPDDGNSYSIRLLGAKEDNPVIPVAFKAGTAGSYTLIADFDPSEFEILELYDKETDITWDLKSNNEYTFYGSTGNNAGRFVLQLVKGTYADPYADLPVRIYAWDKVLNIDLRLVDGTYKCDVYSITGRKVMSVNNLDGGQIAQLSALSVTGIYIVRVSGTEGNYSQKVPVF